MDLINTGTDPWILEHQACEALNRDILELLNQRDSLGDTSKEYDALSARIRNRLKQLTSEVEQLGKKLKLASVASSITAEENERRLRQVDHLESNLIRLRDEFNKRKGMNYSSATISKERYQLMGPKKESSVFVDMGTTSWGDVDSHGPDKNYPIQSTSHKTVDELRNDQKKLLKEQDEGLDTLAKIISRQKQIASNINTEVNEHNELLVNLTQDIDGVQGRIQRETNMTRVILKKDNTWGYWVVIILLLVVIIAVAIA